MHLLEVHMAKQQALDPYVRKSGHLDVGDGHRIYNEDWGNPDVTPVMHLHGGPGAGFSESHKLLYNPKINRVIFHDQRGCGRSTPFASIKDNTTQHLIADIEKLREHFKIGRMYVAGGSWGSTLSMLYAVTHPERVIKMMMWGIYLLRQSEIDYLYQGGPKEILPEAWERFINLVPPKDRRSSDGVIKFYAAKIQSKDKKTALKYAAEWNLWESSTVSLGYDWLSTERQVLSSDKSQQDFNLAIARMESHYFLHGCFVEENYILKNIGKIKHIPAYVVQGRFDLCTPPASALDLAKAYGEKLSLQIVRAGHLRSEPETLAALRAVATTALV
jgi:proline iminopeptidase